MANNTKGHGGSEDRGGRRRGLGGCLPSLVGIKDAGVEDTVKLESDVIGGDGALAGDLNGDLLQALDVSDAVDEWDEDGETGLENATELSHAFDDPSGLLGHEADDGVGGQGRTLEVGRGNGAEAAVTTAMAANGRYRIPGIGSVVEIPGISRGV